MTDTDTAYITIEDAARLLGKSQRTVYRYAEQGRLTTHDTPAGKLFDRSQVEVLAQELNVTPTPVQPVTELVPLSDMLAEMRRKDEQIKAGDILASVPLPQPENEEETAAVHQVSSSQGN